MEIEQLKNVNKELASQVEILLARNKSLSDVNYEKFMKEKLVIEKER